MTACAFHGGHCCCQPQDGVACPDIPRFRLHYTGAINREPFGEWVRWADVQKAILDPLTRCPANQPVPTIHSLREEDKP